MSLRSTGRPRLPRPSPLGGSPLSPARSERRAARPSLVPRTWGQQLRAVPSGGPAGLSTPVIRFERLVLLGVIVATGCSPARDEPATARSPQDSVLADSIARARQDSINRRLPGYVVDSILPVEEELRRFRLAVREQGASTGTDTNDIVTALTSGSDSREALVRRFIKALATN